MGVHHDLTLKDFNKKNLLLMIVKESKHYKRISETKSKFVGGFCQTDLFRSILGAE